MSKTKLRFIYLGGLFVSLCCFLYAFNARAGAGTGAAVGALGTAAATAAIGATIGSGVPIVGTIIGAVVGGAVGALVGFFTSGDEGSYAKILTAFTSIDNGCWFCNIFKTLFSAINTLTNSLSSVLTTQCIRLLGLGLLFYILFKVLKAVISFGEIDAKQFFTDLLMPVLKCLVAMAVLTNLNSFYTQVVNPLAALSIGFATNIQEVGIEQLSSTTEMTSIQGQTVYTSSCSASSSSSSPLGPEVNDAIQCFLKTISYSLIQYLALGGTFIADSFHMGWKIFPHWSMLGTGLCLFIMVFLIFISFPFKLLDGLFRLMFVSALMPMWVVLWVLPQTRQYSKKAFDMFLNVLVTFTVLSVIMLMVLAILGAALGDLANNQEFWKELFNGNTKDALEMIDWSTGTFFTMVAMSFLANSLVGKTESFVNAFVGGNVGGGMGAALEATAVAGVGLIGSKIGKPIAERTAKATGEAIGGTADLVGKGIKNAPRGLGFIAGRAASGRPFRASDIPGSGLAKKVAQQYREGYQQGFGKKGTNGGVDSAVNAAAGAAVSAATGGAVSPAAATAAAKIVTSSLREQMADGKVKDTQMKTFKSATGNVTHKEVTEMISNSRGVLESKLQKRENYDVATGLKKGSTNIETRYNQDGSSTQVKTEFDAMDRKKSTMETTNSGTIKTEYDNLGRAASVTMKDRSGNTSVEKNTFDTAGNRTSFLTEVKDATGKTTEHFRVDLNTHKKTDILTGKVSDYIA